MPSVREMVGPGVARRVRDAVASQRVERGGMYVPLEFRGDSGKDGRLLFRGFANVATVDRVGDVIEPKAFRRSLRSFLKNNPQVFYMHDWYLSVGQITRAEIRDNGLYVEGYVQPATDDEGEPLNGGLGEFVRMVRGQVKRGQLRTLSIGFRLLESKPGKAKDPITGKERDVRVITNLELLEISLVTLPASRESVIQARSFLTEVHGESVANSLVYCEDAGPVRGVAGDHVGGEETRGQDQRDADDVDETGGDEEEAGRAQEVRALAEIIAEAVIDRLTESVRHGGGRNDADDDADTAFEIVSVEPGKVTDDCAVEIVNLNKRT